jgi:hypothetical protein
MTNFIFFGQFMAQIAFQHLSWEAKSEESPRALTHHLAKKEPVLSML